MNNNYYNQNPYANAYYQQPMYQQQPIQQQQQPMVLPMAYVNGLEGAKAFWMGTNATAYLRDNNDDTILYEKKTDSVGRYQMKAFKLTELEVDTNTNTFKTSNAKDNIKTLESKIDAIYAFLAGKNEVLKDEQQ